jgi:NitT/TauT family transport system substrate-binding protein
VSRSRNIALSMVLFIALVSVWEAGVRILQVPQFILPAPSRVAEALSRGIVSGIYIEHLYYTLVSTVLGFILGSALGFGLGTGVAMSRRFGEREGRGMRGLMAIAILLAVGAGAAVPVAAQTKIVMGWCSRTISSATTPFAIATKMGWYKAEGIEVELVPLPGSGDCVKNVATREVLAALPSVEPLAVGRPQGIKAKIFYTAYQGNIYGIAVPADSSVQRFSDLKGKNIGVIAMGSAGVLIARALASTNGMNPDKDINVVVAGEGAQTAALLKTRQVDALSQYDTQYALVENAGVKLRMLDTKDIDRYPSNGFLASEETIKNKRREMIALAKGYAMGTVFAIANPEAAVRILYEVYPATKPTGKDEATAIRDDVKVLQARIVNWRLEKAGVKKWGENSEANYAAYTDFMLKWGIIKEKIDWRDLITNELIDDINKFDAAKITAEAKGYKTR